MGSGFPLRPKVVISVQQPLKMNASSDRMLSALQLFSRFPSAQENAAEIAPGLLWCSCAHVRVRVCVRVCMWTGVCLLVRVFVCASVCVCACVCVSVIVCACV